MNNLTNLPRESGIYQIMHIETGRIYIGSSVNIYTRVCQHRYSLIRGDHHSVYLQRAWDKYTEEAFIADVILTCDKSDLSFHEKYFIKNLYPEFNMNRCADRRIEYSTITDEQRESMRKRTKERWGDPEYRKKHKEGWARTMSTPHTSERMRASRLRVVEERPELALEHSERMKEKFKDKEYLKRHVEITTAAKQDPKFKEDMSRSLKEKWRDPVYSKHLRHLTDDNVIDVLRLRLNGISCQDIADVFNCSIHVIKDISRGRSYKHINRETLEVDPDFYIKKD